MSKTHGFVEFPHETAGRLPLWFEQELPPHHCRLVDRAVHIDPGKRDRSTSKWRLSMTSPTAMESPEDAEYAMADVQERIRRLAWSLPGWRRFPQWVGRSTVFSERRTCERFAILMALASWRHPAARHKYRSTASLNAERRRHMRHRYAAVHPFSPARYYWQIIIGVLSLVSLLWIPFICVKFVMTQAGCESFDSFRQWSFVSFVIEIPFVIDIICGYYTGVCDEATSHVYMDTKTRLKASVTQDLLMNLSSLPFTWLTMLNEPLWAIILSLLRLIHLKSFFAAVEFAIEQYVAYPYLTCRILRAVVMPLVIMHWVSAYMLLFKYVLFGGMYEGPILMMAEKSGKWGCEYAEILFRALVATSSPLFGLWHGEAGNIFQMAFSIIVILIGRLLFLYLFVQMVIIFRIVWEPSRIMMGKVQQLEEFMENRDLPRDQRERLQNYFHFYISKLSFQEKRVLATISGSLKEDIQMHRCRLMVANVTFFQDLPMHVIVRIVVRLSLEIYMMNEVIVLAGTMGSSMYFISSGTVVIYSGSGNEICHLDDGAHFGEIALLSGDQTRIASVVAIETCELYVLRRDAFLEAVAIYPKLLTIVEQTAFERLNQTVAMDQKSRRLTTFSRHSTRFASLDSNERTSSFKSMLSDDASTRGPVEDANPPGNAPKSDEEPKT